VEPNPPPPLPPIDRASPPSGAGPEGIPPTPRRKPSSGPGLSHWTYWWNLNREPLLDLRGLGRKRLAAQTDEAGPHFLGRRTGGKGTDPAVDAARVKIVETLRQAARDRSEDVATGAIIALGKAGDADSAALLMELAKSRKAHGTVNESAALALGMIGDGSEEVRAFLAALAADDRAADRTRAFALLGLGYLGNPGAVPTLIFRSRARESRKDVPAAALLGLGLLGDEIVVPDLSRLLSGRPSARERDDVLRAHCAAALGMIRSRSALPAVVRALGDRDKEVRRQAALSLGALAKPEDAGAVKALLRLLGNDRDAQTRAFAAVSLGEIGATIAADSLLNAYRKGDSTVVPYAALGLAFLARNGGMTEKIAPVLRGQLGSRGSNDLRGALAIALGILGDRPSVKPLIRVLEKRGDPALRAHVAIALGLIGSDEARPALRAAVAERSSPDLQREAAIALGLLGDREAADILETLVRSGRTEYVRGSAALALGRLATPQKASALREYLADDGNPATTRAFVAVALGLVLDRADVPMLSRVGEHFNHRMATEAEIEVLTLL
jgi:HEAT repeat protein